MWRSRRVTIVALALVAIGGAYAYTARQQRETTRRDAEATLRTQLTRMRRAIAAFKSEHGRFPRTLQELTPKHLAAIPVDPMTGSSATWQLTTEVSVLPNDDFSTSTAKDVETYVIDVRSGAGSPWSDY